MKHCTYRPTTPTALAFAVALCALPTAASAQVDAERFKPAVTPDGWVNAEGSGVRSPQDPLELGVYLNYAKNSLVTVDSAGNLEDELVSGRLGGDLLASYTLADPFVIGVGLPFYLVQTGDADPPPTFGGLGDLRIVPKLRLLDDRESVGLALLVELRAPTHTGEFSGGARNLQAIPKLAVDHRFKSGIRLGANAGVAIREDTRFFNIIAGDEVVYALALGYRFDHWYRGKTEIGAELNGGIGLSQTDREELPLEALLYVRHGLSEELELQAGPGFGLIPGFGVPIFRVFAGLRYRPTDHDRDGDGISDEDDRCPDQAEDWDRQEDTDGCPEEDPDDDQDGIPNDQDDCPSVKETINGVDDEDGCPDQGDPRVVYEDGQVKVLEHVQFESGSAEISPESHSLLDQVALTIKANPEIEKVQVEGHTDERGEHDMNVRLSQRRAESVQRYLEKKGVQKDRLSAKGYGPDKPLLDEDTAEAHAKNRRVEFVVK